MDTTSTRSPIAQQQKKAQSGQAQDDYASGTPIQHQGQDYFCLTVQSHTGQAATVWLAPEHAGSLEQQLRQFADEKLGVASAR